MKISELRKNLDTLDDKILDLLNKRAEYAESIGKQKKTDNLALHDIKREMEILSRLNKLNKGPLTKDHIKILFTEIFSVCLSLQRHTKVVYLGPQATYTHIAAVSCFGKSHEYIPVKTINDVFTEVEKDAADFGVVPVENSTEGMVNYTLDVFMESDLNIYAEIFMDIHHNLVSKSKKLSEVKKIFSHTQPLGQCRSWIEKNLPKARIIEVDSTSLAAERASKTEHSAAIASDVAAFNYHLGILAERIQDTVQNMTRFFVISKQTSEDTDKSKTSILFSIKDRVGALYDMLIPFREAGINLTKIESRPTKKKAWEYVFFIDFIGHKDDKKVIKALKALGSQCLFLKILGSYPARD
ncbi:prephenate dehydratase [bacterium]